MAYDKNFEPIKERPQLLTKEINRRTITYYVDKIEHLKSVLPFLTDDSLEIDGTEIELPLDKEPKLFLAQCHIWYERTKSYQDNDDDIEDTYALYSDDQLHYYYAFIYPQLDHDTFKTIQEKGRQLLLSEAGHD